MKLTEIKHTQEFATGVCVKNKRPVIIEKSISYIYKKSDIVSNGIAEVRYIPLIWKDKIEFGLMEALLLDYEINPFGHKDLDDIVIRFGWISQDMLQLEWVPIRLLYDKFLNGKLTPTEKNKFQNICRTLSIPMRQMSKVRKDYLNTKKVA